MSSTYVNKTPINSWQVNPAGGLFLPGTIPGSEQPRRLFTAVNSGTVTFIWRITRGTTGWGQYSKIYKNGTRLGEWNENNFAFAYHWNRQTVNMVPGDYLWWAGDTSNHSAMGAEVVFESGDADYVFLGIPDQIQENVFRFKRRINGPAGAPTTLNQTEIAINESEKVGYIGIGSSGNGDEALNVIPLFGRGAFLNLAGNDTVYGVKTFEGEIHVPVPVQDAQAANKAYVATKLAEAISRAFIVKGGLSAATNTLPTNPIIGHMYKVTEAGNFGGATSFVASAGDFVLYNGTSWDKIDNTDPSYVGTTDRIVVTRLGENSYQFDLSENYAGQSTITTLGTVTQGTWNGSIVALAYGGIGANLTLIDDGAMTKKVGTAFVPAVKGEDYIARSYGKLSGGRF